MMLAIPGHVTDIYGFIVTFISKLIKMVNQNGLTLPLGDNNVTIPKSR